jgi:hypothetical protein
MATQCTDRVLHVLIAGRTYSASRWICQQYPYFVFFSVLDVMFGFWECLANK